MDTILVVGVETVVGANLAAALAESHHVVAMTSVPSVAVSDCETVPTVAPNDARRALDDVKPGRAVLCGPAAVACWEADERSGFPGVAAEAQAWAVAAAAAGVPLTVVSSDAVFTGPWMFHRENSTSQCPSAAAAAIRAMEDRVVEGCPAALVVRTHAYGFSPLGAAGWIETALDSLAARSPGGSDCVRHATPILATDLVEPLQAAWKAGLSGVHHCAGAERINPARFLERLAEEFELPVPLRCRIEPLSCRPEGFGCGETSLHTRKLRRALGIAMPTVDDGLRRLHAQAVNGHRDRLRPNGSPARTRVA